MKTATTDPREPGLRIARIQGQLRGVRKMIADGRYCLDIAAQLKSVSGALQGLRQELTADAVRVAGLEAHRRNDAAPLQRCIAELLIVPRGDRVVWRATAHARGLRTSSSQGPGHVAPIEEATS